MSAGRANISNLRGEGRQGESLHFDYEGLPREFPRRYVPDGLRFEWEDLSKVYAELLGRVIDTSADLEKWLADESELRGFVNEQKAIRYINSTRQTDSEEYRKAFERYTEELEPKVKVADFELSKKFVAAPQRTGLPPSVYALESRRRETEVSIFREANVEVQKQDSLLSQEYQRTIGAMTVIFRGQELTLKQMSKFYEEPSRDLRKEAWVAADARTLQDAEAMDSIYDKMVELRTTEARNSGFDDYREYVFAKKFRFDYGPADCLSFHDAVEAYLVPLSRDMDRDRQRLMGVDVLKPWDLSVDPEGRPPLAPFEDVGGLVSGCSKVLSSVDPVLAGYFSRMADLGLLDLESRKGKAPGGYQEELSEVRLPFIFMNAAKRDDDVRTLLHESGHSFQTFLMREAGLPYFNANENLQTEFAEVASMTMELISGRHLEGAFYDPAGARRSNKEELVGIVKLFTWVATIDAFQHWVYTHPGHSRDERRKAWVSTFNRFSGLESYDGLEESLAYRWHRQLHIFEVPFYYIEYGIATIGALGLWRRYDEDKKSAIDSYKKALSLGGSRSLPELFGAAGLEWDIGPRSLAKLSADLRTAVKEYS